MFLGAIISLFISYYYLFIKANTDNKDIYLILGISFLILSYVLFKLGITSLREE
jgi:hypothetical protein